MMKRIVTILTCGAIALLLTVLCFGIVRTQAATEIPEADRAAHNTATHCVCAGHSIAAVAAHDCTSISDWTPWIYSDSLPTTSGHYYLTGTVKITSKQTITADAEIVLCLNGQTVTSTVDTMYSVSTGAKLTLTDCTESTDPDKTGASSISVTGSKSNGGRMFRTVSDSSATLNIYYGNYDASGCVGSMGLVALLYKCSFNLYNGTIIGGPANQYAGSVYILSKSTMKMYGGTIKGGSTTGSGAPSDNAMDGGNLKVNASTFEMYGGRITRGQAKKAGGNISTSGAVTIKIAGGMISSGKSTTYGGNILLNDTASLSMTGGTITGGKSGTYGGNVVIGKTASMTINGANALVTEGRSTTNTGNIHINGLLKLEKGTISYGKCGWDLVNDELKTSSTGRNGGNVSVTTTGTFIMNNGTISYGQAVAKHSSRLSTGGGNVNVEKGGVFEMNGGTLTNGDATYGGNVRLDAGSSFYFYGGTVTLGRAFYYKTSSTDTAGTATDGRGSNINIIADATTTTDGVSVTARAYMCMRGKATVGALGTGNARHSTGIHPVGGTLDLYSGYIAHIQVNGSRFTLNQYGGTVENMGLYNGTANLYGGTILKFTSAAANNNSQGTANFYGATIQTFSNSGTPASDPTHINIYGGLFKTDVTAIEDSRFTVDPGVTAITGSWNHKYLTSAGAYDTKTYTVAVTEAAHNHALGVHADANATLPAEATSEIVWLPWYATNALPEAGSYFLKNNVALSAYRKTNATSDTSAQLNPFTETNICLNGHSISSVATDGTRLLRTIMMQQTAVLSVCDCETTGEIKGGALSNGTGGAVCVSGQTKDAAPVFNFYSGIIRGTSVEGTAADEDGGVALAANKGGSINIYGGTVIGAASTAYGGIAIIRDSGTKTNDNKNPGTLNIYGGMFSGGSAGERGDGIAVLGGNLNIEGGVFSTAGSNELIYVGKKSGTDKGTVSINGGYFAGSIVKADGKPAFITGGYFTVAPEEKLVDIHKAAKLLVTPVVKDGVTYGFGIVDAFIVSTTSAVPKTGETGVAALTGAGTIANGDTVTLTAPESAHGYHFLGWYKDAYSKEAKAIDNGAKTITLTAGTDFSADTEYIAAYQLDARVYTLTVNGSAFTITAGGNAVEYGDNGAQIESGAEVVVTYAGDDNEMDFFGWQNMSGKTLTAAGEYTFTMQKDTEIKANEAEKNVKTIVFTNGSGQVLYTFTGSIDVLPAVPVRVGYKSAWSKTLDQINESVDKYIMVEADFTKNTSATYTVTIEDVRGDEANVSRALNPVDIGSRVLLTAAEYEGYKFAYFKVKVADEKILSYTAPVYSIFGKDTTVYAVYVLEEALVVKKPTMNLAATVETTNNGKITKFTATRDIPEGYTLLEHGILYQVGAKTEAQMNYGDSRKAISDATGLLGTVSLNIGLVPNGYSITARGYAIIKNAAGETSYLYSDIITVTAEASNP